VAGNESVRPDPGRADARHRLGAKLEIMELILNLSRQGWRHLHFLRVRGGRPLQQPDRRPQGQGENRRAPRRGREREPHHADNRGGTSMTFWKSLNRAKILWPLVALDFSSSSTCSSLPLLSDRIEERALFGNLIDIIKNAHRSCSWQSGSRSSLPPWHRHFRGIGGRHLAGVVAILSAVTWPVTPSTDRHCHDRGPPGLHGGRHVERNVGIPYRHAADHRDPDPLRCRSGHRDGIYERDGHLALYKAIRAPGAGLRVRLPFSIYIVAFLLL